jgi:hypothetical protein
MLTLTSPLSSVSPFAATLMKQLDVWIELSAIEGSGGGDMSDAATGGQAGSCARAATAAQASHSSSNFRRDG